MKRLSIGRYALSFCATAVLFTGCAGSSSLGTVSAAMPQTPRSAPTEGGAFSAMYSGTYHKRGECLSGNGDIKLRGTGNASFLNESKESETLKGHELGHGICHWDGPADLRSSTHSGDSIIMHVRKEYDLSGCRCMFNVVGGTGKFVDATGSGTVTVQFSNNKYSEEWSGTIHY